MPGPDDTHSGDGESDNDYADQLSPSDGYFASGSSSNAVPNVPNVMVHDPTVQDSDTKAAEAKREALLNTSSTRGDMQPQALSARDFNSYAQSSAPSARSDSTNPIHTPPSTARSNTPSSHATSATPHPLRTHLSTGRTPSLYSEAPPAYTPSQTVSSQTAPSHTDTTPLTPATETDYSRNYGSISPTSPTSPIMGVEDERLLGRDPESMGEPDEEAVYTPRWNKRFRRRCPPWFKWKFGLLALVLLGVTAGFLTSGYKAIKDDDKKTIEPIMPGDPTRPTEPEPVIPGEPTSPEQPSPPALDPLRSTFCQNAQYRFPDQIMALRFGPKRSLSFVQEIINGEGNMNVRVGGQVNIRRIDGGGYPRVVLEIVTSDDLLRLNSLINGDNQAMKISVPRLHHSDNTEEQPCVEMRATIWLPKDAELQELSISTTQLDILTFDDLSLQVHDFSNIATITGDAIAGTSKSRSYESSSTIFDDAPDFVFIPAKESYTFDSRIIEVKSTTGLIAGNWPLYDMLGLHVTSGRIKTSITPKPALESAPKPAVLSISSISGVIRAIEPIHEQKQIPVRDYLVDVKSTSGEIHAAVAFGTGIELKSTASDITVDLLPVLDSDTISPKRPAQLETVTTSGLTAVRILEPIWYGQKSAAASPEFNCLEALHKSTSANIGLIYPQSWVGDFEAESTTLGGHLSVRGKGVRITKANFGWTGGKVEGYKGKSGGGSTIRVNTLVGNLDAVFGDE